MRYFFWGGASFLCLFFIFRIGYSIELTGNEVRERAGQTRSGGIRGRRVYRVLVKGCPTYIGFY